MKQTNNGFISCPSLQERRWIDGACPKNGYEAGEGAGIWVLWRLAEETGLVQSGEKEAEGRLCWSLQLPKGGCGEVDAGLQSNRQ